MRTRKTIKQLSHVHCKSFHSWQPPLCLLKIEQKTIVTISHHSVNISEKNMRIKTSEADKILKGFSVGFQYCCRIHKSVLLCIRWLCRHRKWSVRVSGVEFSFPFFYHEKVTTNKHKTEKRKLKQIERPRTILIAQKQSFVLKIQCKQTHKFTAEWPYFNNFFLLWKILIIHMIFFCFLFNVNGYAHEKWKTKASKPKKMFL